MFYDCVVVIEYDDWEMFGNGGWNWDIFFSVMKRVENFMGINLEYYGFGGVGILGFVKLVINRYIFFY